MLNLLRNTVSNFRVSQATEDANNFLAAAGITGQVQSQAIYNLVLRGTPADAILEKSFGGGNKSVAQATSMASLLSDIAKTNKPASKKTTAKKATVKKTSDK